MGDAEVLVTNTELLSVLAGRPVRFAVQGGGTAVVRLATPEELIRSVDAAQPAGGPRRPLPLDKAMELCQPIDLLAGRGRF